MDLGNLATRLGEAVRWRTLTRHEHLFRRGDPAVAMYVVGHGRIRLVRFDHGAEVVQHVAGAGETLAEAALFVDAYHCDAIAETESRVATLPRRFLLSSIERDPELLREFLSGLARQVQDARWRLQLRNVRPARQRVWQYLLSTAGSKSLPIDRPVRDIALEVGLTPEAVYRALAQLKADGRVTGRGRLLRLVHSSG